MGKPFKTIKGPGVWLVESMTDLEEKLRKRGLETEYKIQNEDRSFTWPSESPQTTETS